MTSILDWQMKTLCLDIGPWFLPDSHILAFGLIFVIVLYFWYSYYIKYCLSFTFFLNFGFPFTVKSFILSWFCYCLILVFVWFLDLALVFAIASSLLWFGLSNWGNSAQKKERSSISNKSQLFVKNKEMLKIHWPKQNLLGSELSSRLRFIVRRLVI